MSESIEKMINDTFGEGAKDMIYLGALATAPAFQRRGYGGALVEAINDIVHQHNLPVVLFTDRCFSRLMGKVVKCI